MKNLYTQTPYSLVRDSSFVINYFYRRTICYELNTDADSRIYFINSFLNRQGVIREYEKYI